MNADKGARRSEATKGHKGRKELVRRSVGEKLWRNQPHSGIGDGSDERVGVGPCFAKDRHAAVSWYAKHYHPQGNGLNDFRAGKVVCVRKGLSEIWEPGLSDAGDGAHSAARSVRMRAVLHELNEFWKGKSGVRSQQEEAIDGLVVASEKAAQEVCVNYRDGGEFVFPCWGLVADPGKELRNYVCTHGLDGILCVCVCGWRIKVVEPVGERASFVRGLAVFCEKESDRRDECGSEDEGEQCPELAHCLSVSRREASGRAN